MPERTPRRVDVVPPDPRQRRNHEGDPPSQRANAARRADKFGGPRVDIGGLIRKDEIGNDAPIDITDKPVALVYGLGRGPPVGRPRADQIDVSSLGLEVERTRQP